MVGLSHGREHVLEVRPKFRMVFGDLVLPNPREEYDGAAVGVAELSEQLIGAHAERLISAPDDHPGQSGWDRSADGGRTLAGGVPPPFPYVDRRFGTTTLAPPSRVG
jgi:hypothetical protein